MIVLTHLLMACPKPFVISFQANHVIARVEASFEGILYD